MSPPPPSYFSLDPGRTAIPALDGLRGIAIILVVLYHGFESFGAQEGQLLPVTGWDLATPFYSGWMGVNLFFVLSGFLITWHLLRRWQTGAEPIVLREYLARRFLRIVPTYYVVLAVTAAGVIPYYTVDQNLMGLQLAWHAAFLQDYLPSSILGPFWSLGVEEKFYLAMPLVAVLASRLPRLRWRLALIAGIALAPLAVRLAMYGTFDVLSAERFIRNWRNPFHLNLDSLFLGALAAFLLVARPHVALLQRPRIADRLLLTGAALVAGLMVAPSLLSDTRVFYHIAVFPLTALGMALILFGAVLKPAGASPLLESRWLAYAGRIAYPWYLTHLLVLHWLWGSMTARFPGLGGLPPERQLAAFLPVYLAASTAAGILLHFAVEKPCLILKDRIGRRQILLGAEAA
jgi:peptidoglycan/LPS O-acetylase OafA/YrhL